MEQFQLDFDEAIVKLERENFWKGAVDIALQEWMAQPDNINRFLCAGVQLWHTLLIMDYIRNEPFPPEGVEFPPYPQMQSNLVNITQYGFDHFVDNPIFNSYFGYMISVMPHFFIGPNGNYLEWQERGLEMIRRSYIQSPDNPFVKAMYHALDDCSKGTPYYEACLEIWSNITPTQWGNSAAQQYFFHILHGDSFYINAYSQ